MSNAEKIHVLDKKVTLLQPLEGFNTSLDSVMLAAACSVEAGQRVLDIGCGVGSASFCLIARVPDCFVTGVDIQRDHIEIAQENAVLNAVENQSDFICEDVLSFEVSKPDQRFDHVICNPPYYEAGEHMPSPKESRAKALGHDDVQISIRDWVLSGLRNLKSGGSLTIIHRADASDRIIRALGKSFGAIEIIPLWPKAGQDAKRVIVRAIKDRKTPAKIHAGLVLHKDNGDYTAEAESILRNAAPLK